MTLPFAGPSRNRTRQSDLDTFSTLAPTETRIAEPFDATPLATFVPSTFGIAPAEMADAVRAHLANRRARDTLFPGGWFADPAWDLMLDLFACELEGGQIAVSSACIAAGVPTTTALRCLNRLVEAGFLVRTVDPDDARRSLVTLDPGCAMKVGHWVAHALMRAASESGDRRARS